jgi:hypothetical protein
MTSLEKIIALPVAAWQPNKCACLEQKVQQAKKNKIGLSGSCLLALLLVSSQPFSVKHFTAPRKLNSIFCGTFQRTQHVDFHPDPLLVMLLDEGHRCFIVFLVCEGSSVVQWSVSSSSPCPVSLVHS